MIQEEAEVRLKGVLAKAWGLQSKDQHQIKNQKELMKVLLVPHSRLQVVLNLLNFVLLLIAGWCTPWTYSLECSLSFRRRSHSQGTLFNEAWKTDTWVYSLFVYHILPLFWALRRFIWNPWFLWLKDGNTGEVKTWDFLHAQGGFSCSMIVVCLT